MCQAWLHSIRAFSSPAHGLVFSLLPLLLDPCAYSQPLVPVSPCHLLNAYSKPLVAVSPCQLRNAHSQRQLLNAYSQPLFQASEALFPCSALPAKWLQPPSFQRTVITCCFLGQDPFRSWWTSSSLNLDLVGYTASHSSLDLQRHSLFRANRLAFRGIKI